MGSTASKGAKAAGSAARKYPTRTPTSTTTTSTTTTTTTHKALGIQARGNGPTVHPELQATSEKTNAVLNDGRDPAFASRLSSLGAVQPNPHYSPSSLSQFDPARNVSPSLPSDTMMNALPQSAFPDPRNNPVLRVLEARQRIAEAAEEELRDVGRKGFKGRTYVDAGLVTLALMRRERGEPVERIEESLGIRKGRLGVLGEEGVVGSVELG